MAKRIENLKRNSDRTKAELQEMGRKGGKASGKKRRELRELRGLLQALLDLPLNPANLSDLSTIEELEALGVPAEMMTQKTSILWHLIWPAQHGNVPAVKLILQIMGELPTGDKEAFTPSENSEAEALD